MKAKEQFRLSAYAQTLATLEKLVQESDLPGNEAYRAQLRPGLAFYRAASLAALGRAEEARPEFEVFLAYQPNAALDPGAFPPKVIAALEEARAGLSAEPRKPAETGSLATTFRTFTPEVSRGPSEAGEDWAESPVSYLLTARQRRDYSRLSGPLARSEFITEFWKSRDPRPETPENEAREEFEKRVAFADAQLAEKETRGSLTDRGMVFVLLGPPTWVGRKPLRTGEDTADPSGMSIYSDQDVSNTLRGLSGASSAVAWDKMTGPSNRMPDSQGNYRELWHYRREQLPPGVPFLQVDFDFITRDGYGKNVWQRDSQTLATVEISRESMKAGLVSRTASH
jgi:GWxTD domain-containing protein